MKKQMMPSTPLKGRTSVVTVFLVAAFLTLTAGSTYARPVNDEPKPVITYLGKINNEPVLQIAFENRQEKPYSISIEDPHGTVLYSGEFRDKSFSKKFRIALDEPGDIRLTITFTSGKYKETQVFETQTNTYVKQDVFIGKL